MTLSKFVTRLWHCATILLKVPLHVFYLASGFVPRNRHNWLFGCWNGQQYRGNSKYLFDYVRENYPAINAAWITKNRAVLNDLRSRGVTETWEDIHRHLRDICLHSRDEYQQQRTMLRDLIYPSPDGKCCERLVKFALEAVQS